jgi:phosphatidylglycerophosphate synthase
MPASPLGKLKMVSQVVAILALILGKDHLHGFVVIGQIALWIVVLTALASAADYFRRFGMLLTQGGGEAKARTSQIAAQRSAELAERKTKAS